MIVFTTLIKSAPNRFIRILNQPFNAPKVLSTVIPAVDKCLLKTFWCLGQFCLKGKGLTCHIVENGSFIFENPNFSTKIKSAPIRFIGILNQLFNAPKVLSTVIPAVYKCLLKTFWCLGPFGLTGKGLTCHIVDGYALSLRIKDRTLNPSTLLVGCASLISFGLVNK